MKKIHLCTTLTLLLIMASKGLVAQVAVTDLHELAVIRDDVKSKRISSFDRSGGNADGGEQIMNGETRVLIDVKGAGMINHIWITIGPPTPGVISRNDIILRMYWDGSDIPSVVSPIGPFFGQGWDECYDFSSLPLSSGPVEGRGLVCYFTMPFAKGAKIEIENQTGRILEAFYYYVDYTEMRSLPEKMGRFHAWYNHELTEAPEDGENEWGVLGPQGNNPDGKKNYLIADINGLAPGITTGIGERQLQPDNPDIIFPDVNHRVIAGIGSHLHPVSICIPCAAVVSGRPGADDDVIACVGGPAVYDQRSGVRAYPVPLYLRHGNGRISCIAYGKIIAGAFFPFIALAYRGRASYIF